MFCLLIGVILFSAFCLVIAMLVYIFHLPDTLPAVLEPQGAYVNQVLEKLKD